jgi:hypothetical protein
MEMAREALTEGRCPEVRYDGYARVVEVHACGYTRDGNAVMRVWQVRGDSTSGQRTGWKMLRLDESQALAILQDEASEAPRPGYKRGDVDMSRIVAEV